jgi:hypothetical protein
MFSFSFAILILSATNITNISKAKMWETITQNFIQVCFSIVLIEGVPSQIFPPFDFFSIPCAPIGFISPLPDN